MGQLDNGLVDPLYKYSVYSGNTYGKKCYLCQQIITDQFYFMCIKGMQSFGSITRIISNESAFTVSQYSNYRPPTGLRMRSLNSSAGSTLCQIKT